jgi:PAS domain-containing protein
MTSKPTMPNSPAKNRIRDNAGLRESGDKPEHGPMMTELYLNAEAQLRKQKKKLKTENPKLQADSQRLLHELQVHQVELEMQNGELQEARERMEVLLEKYTDLYDFAPVGYFSLDEQGKILEANLSGATLLGVERSPLINQRLPSHVAPANCPQTVRSREQSTSSNWSRTRFVRDRGPAKNYPSRCIAVSILPSINFPVHVRIIPTYVLI